MNLGGLSSRIFLFQEARNQGRPIQDWSQRKTQKRFFWEEGSVANNPGGLWILERPMPSSPEGADLGMPAGLEKRKLVLKNERLPVT